MSIVNIVFLIIRIASAIITVTFTYKFAIESNFHPIATADMCVIMAILAGGLSGMMDRFFLFETQ